MTDSASQRFPLPGLNELIEVQIFSRCCAAWRDGEQSRKGDRPNSVNEHGLIPSHDGLSGAIALERSRRKKGRGKMVKERKHF